MTPASPSRAEVETLRAIRTIPQLLEYLRDTLHWPIESETVEDLTFDYSPEELGIDPKTAVKIRHIRQLRPLASRQPWGIFLIDFEPKKLPVVVLRRVLQRLVIDRRGRAKKAELQAWQRHDLLFISSFGENDERALTFAHFADAPSGRTDDLPTLKVLGWDAGDTLLHLDKVHSELMEHLRWPADANKVAEWRDQWAKAFTLSHRHSIMTSKDLAQRLAGLAVQIRAKANQVLRVESSTGPIRTLQKAFQQALIRDLDDDGFADLYAQTISYGLLSARIIEGPRATADSLADRIPITNPFLKELLQSFLKAGGRAGRAGRGGIDFDELGVSDIVDLLNSPTTNMEAVLRDFGNRNRGEDPVLHFYELFLAAYDKKQKVQRGVFYTPQPVVSFMVRSVHELLRTEFGLADGLADTTTWGEMLKKHPGLKLPPLTDDSNEKRTISPDEPFVQILDPATGTATFPVEVIDVIHRTLTAKWKSQRLNEAQQIAAWNEYVPKHLLPRLHAYELMMAPYAIAHMKIGLKLAETGYRFGAEERARIYLTNALEPSARDPKFPEFEALAHEAAAVNDIKRHKQFTVVIGNPPYSAVSSNLSPEARAMVDPYRYFRGVLIDERGALQFEKNINDDYVKFLRLGEQCLERHVGILAYISNNGYLESPTLRGLREHLSGTFASIDIVDLHGDQDRRERAPDGSADENVFDIKRGVAIALLRRGALASGGNCSRIDVFGSRAAKYLRLNEMCLLAIDRQSFRPAGALCLFANQDEIVVGEYEAGISVTDLFPVGTTGFESGRDEILVAFTEQELRAKLQRFATEMGSVIEAEYSVEEAWGRHLFEHRASIVKEPSWHQRIRPVLMAPFDIRYCFFRKDLLKTNSWSAGQHLRNGGNIALMCMRQVVLDGSYMHVGVSRAIVNNRAFASQKGKVSYHPLLLDPEEPQLGDSRTLHRDLEPNVSAVAAELLRSDDGSDDAWTLLHLVIAETHSARYRSRYADCLRREFPRVFRPRSELLLQELVQLGADLVAMWLLEPGYRFASWNQANSPKVNPFVHEVTTFVDAGDREVRKAGEVNRRLAPSPKGSGYGRVYINDTARFEGVPEAVWRFQVGGYQVCEKWLKDRKGRTLSNDDIEHYQKIVVALSETIRIMAEIDKVIEAHGGWPGAFVKAAADKV